MSRKAVSGIVLILLLMGMLTLTSNIGTVNSEPKTWTVDDDGPADFHTIQEAINAANLGDTIFVCNGTYYEHVSISKDNLNLVGENRSITIIDGNSTGIVITITANFVNVAGFTIRGRAEAFAVELSRSYNVTVRDNMISTGYYSSVFLWKSYDSNIIQNTVLPYEGSSTEVYDALHVDRSFGNRISDNIIVSNYNRSGIALTGGSTDNNIVNNTVSMGKYGIYLWNSSKNSMYHNNFINNTQQVHDISWDHPRYPASINSWDDGYPSGGNYWSDCNSTDLHKGPFQNETGYDGIGDTPYVIDENNQDNYPLMEPWTPVTLTVIGPWAGAERDKFMPVLEAFEEKTGMNVEYKILRPSDLATILPSRFEANKTPGDVIFMWAWFIAQQAQNGHVLEVTDLIDETDFLSGTFDRVTVDGSVYGGAYTGKVKPGFWYRKSNFEDWAITPTTVNSTWSEFMAMLSEVANHAETGIPIASGDGVGWPLSDTVEHFLITYGGSQLQRDLIAGNVAWNSSPVETIFADKIIPLLTGGYFSEPTEWTTAVELWWEGNYGLYFMGSWITGMVDNATDLGIIPLPGCEALVLPADYFFIPAYTEYPEEAKELFQFLASAEAQRLQVAQGGHIATNIHVSSDAYPPTDRDVAEAVEGMEVLPDLDDTIGGQFQTTFWDQLKLLWIDPTKLDQVLAAIQAAAPQPPLPEIEASIDINPHVLNMRSRGKWITCYIEVPEGYNVSDINVTSIMLNDTIPVDLDAPTEIWDYDNDTVPDLMVKFNRTAVSEYILSQNVTYGNVTLTLTGELYNGTIFEGNDVVGVSALLGDVNCDGTVDLKDVFSVGLAFGECPGRPRWTPTADVNGDNIVDLKDVFMVATNFGRKWE